MSRIEFEEGLNSLKRDYSSEIFTPTNILTKITILKSVNSSNPQKDVVKWIRIHGRFKLVSYQGSEILYLREKRTKQQKELSQQRNFRNVRKAA